MAEAVWCVEALKADCEVTLITFGSVDLDQLNCYFGTQLRRGEFTLHTVPMPLGLHRCARFTALQSAFFQRYVRRLAPEFDVMISAYNPCDFGVPGIQLIGDFTFSQELCLTMHPALRDYRRWWYGDSPLRTAYLGLCRSIWRPDPAGWKRNVTVANSDWTGDLLRREFGTEARTIYPPVAEDIPLVPWGEREDGFLCVGKIVPEMRPDAAIRILSGVRERGHNVHLHILGGLDSSAYAKRLKKLVETNLEWVFLEGMTYGERKKHLLGGHRYGIHACENEAFGIALAEMAKAGCITFAPNGGGQREILDHPLLAFSDEEDAVEKIAAVLASDPLKVILRQHLAARARKFSAEKFASGIRAVVFEFLEQKEIISQRDLAGPPVSSVVP
jgi:glycosyltransferase involved in cell wall biosynthesis